MSQRAKVPVPVPTHSQHLRQSPVHHKHLTVFAHHDVLATHASTSRARLFANFTRETGMSPNDWLQRRRIPAPPHRSRRRPATHHEPQTRRYRRRVRLHLGPLFLPCLSQIHRHVARQAPAEDVVQVKEPAGRAGNTASVS